MKPEVEKAEMELFLKGELKTDDDAKEDANATVAPAVS
jgi:phosphatidylinositol phospholipase C, beta